MNIEKQELCVNNEYDKEFDSIIQYIKANDENEILLNMIKAVNNLKTNNSNTYNVFVNYFNEYPLWGSFNPDFGDFTTLRLRAEVLKQHLDDFIWLYKRLEDYLSKRTLIAILSNWTFMDTSYLVRIKSIFKDYWEPDLFPSNKDDVLVDVGAFNGDSIISYTSFYGANYKKIYAYEITPSSCNELKANIKEYNLHDVIVRQKGAGSKQDKMFIEDNLNNSSANKLNKNGKISVEIVRLEDDIDEIPTFIKMDIEGAEKDAIKGLENVIKNHTPKLAICPYHGYDDIWLIPEMINEMNSNYKFYLRHNGGNLIPTEFVLLCKPNK